MKENLCKNLNHAAMKSINYFNSKLTPEGSYGAEIHDISAYYKSPAMFTFSGKFEEAKKILSYIKNKFIKSNGDFLTEKDEKSIKLEYEEYWAYINGWIVLAAQKLNFREILIPAGNYLKKFYDQSKKRFITNQPEINTHISDVLTTAHLGLLHLEMHNEEIALTAGEYLCEFFDKQPDIKKGLYLRSDSKGEVLIDFKKEKTLFYFVDKFEPNQLYFMLGYPAAYLALLYQATSKDKFLKKAKNYLDFLLSCHENVFTSHFSHKVAWACSIVYSITLEERYLLAAEKIINSFLQSQATDGLWYPDADKNTRYDQSAEIACWFLKIKNLISGA